ncbi:PLP-dependent cysteine synthase family protein [Helicobacter suis]|nr:cysteine synthase family protein [Helicobacter suis]BCD46152.1 Cysteine synthase CysK [Helicobacter suis]BCD47925.1 Cysteine synthase CysK [Helicobacter suis]BCD49683.1 Cysteine synthase CysK [Helicobacter suis]BCD51118.1 Cysteine synthase CysK [Helicobacter suis]BCD70343.1 Cysteine synthase CysK [Helicobacter suis]
MVISATTQAIGSTPVFKFSKENYPLPKDSVIYAKLEHLNPGGSIKDRLGKYLIEEGLKTGQITPKTTIIEPTAGNTGIALALVALHHHLKTIFVVPEKFSVEKQQLMKALGAEVINTPSEEGIIGAIAKSKELAQSIPDSYLPLQFENPKNPDTYYYTLGPEIIQELGNQLTSFVAGIGSGGTFAGTAKYLKEQIPSIRLIGVEPEGSILNGGVAHPHKIEGIGVEFIPPFLADLPIERFETISDDEGFYYTKELARKSGLLVGSSSGAAFAAALREIERLPERSCVLTIFADAADRYLSKGIYL